MKKLNNFKSYLTRLRGLTVILIALVTIGVGKVWASDVTINTYGWSQTGTSSSGSTIQITSSPVSVSATRGYVSEGNDIRIYYKNTYDNKFVVTSTIAMTKITINGSSSDINISSASGSGSAGTWSSSNHYWTKATQSDGETTVTFNISSKTTMTSIVVEYAGYSLFFSKNGATAGTVPGAVVNSSYSWSASIPYHAGVNDLRNANGCHFECWNTAKDGSGTDYYANQTYYGSGDKTLYVKWGNCTYDVTYNLTGVTKVSGTSSVTGSTTSDVEASFTIDNGYTNTGISVSVTMNGYDYSSSASLTSSFDANGGSLTFGPGYYDGDIVITIVAQAKPCTPITPSLEYSSAAMTVGDVASTPTLTGNTGGGTVTYSITSGSSHVSGLSPSTGVFTAASAGDITVKATIAEKTSGGTTYCGNSATYNITIAALTHTVTWHINGVTSTTQVADGTKPTAPTVDVSDYCGDKFIGWTRCEISGSVGSESSVSANGCGLIKTASGFPNVTSNDVEYYAVFADQNP